jgi:hypothetical protein
MTNRLAEILHRDDATMAKHEARALRALASHRCSTDMTDGFCQPEDGACRSPLCVNRGREDRDCMRQARGLLQALRTLGMTVVWEHDPALQPASSATSGAAADTVAADDGMTASWLGYEEKAGDK